jgi:hypothetical protein
LSEHDTRPAAGPRPGPGERLRAVVVAALLILPLWGWAIAPSGPRWLPWRVRPFWQITALFPRRVDAWPSHHVLIRRGDGLWTEVAHGPPFNQRLFGQMTRLDMLMLHFSPRPADHADPAVAGARRGVLAAACAQLAAAKELDAATDSLVLVRRYTPVASGRTEQRWQPRLAAQPANLLPGDVEVAARWPMPPVVREFGR